MLKLLWIGISLVFGIAWLITGVPLVGLGGIIFLSFAFAEQDHEDEVKLCEYNRRLERHKDKKGKYKDYI